MSTSFSPADTNTPLPIKTLSPARQAAYRRFALTVLGADIETLTSGLRRRRLALACTVRLVPPASRAA